MAISFFRAPPTGITERSEVILGGRGAQINPRKLAFILKPSISLTIRYILHNTRIAVTCIMIINYQLI